MLSTYLITHAGSKFDVEPLLQNFSKSQAFSKNDAVIRISEDKFALHQVNFLDIVCSEVMMPFVTLRWFLRQNSNFMYRLAHCRFALKQVLRGALSVIQALVSKNKCRRLKLKNLRLLNISTAHMRALTQGSTSDTDFLCILEDDGMLSDVAGLTKVINWIESCLDPSQPTLVDLSDSFTFSELGLEPHDLTEILDLPEHLQKVFQTSRPTTNTCAAVVYSRAATSAFKEFLGHAMVNKLTRSVPIDWQLNRFIMAESRSYGLKTFHVTPGLIKQGSLKR